MFTLIIIAVIGLWFYGKHRIKRAVAHVEQQMPLSDQSMNGSRRDAFEGQFEEIKTTKIK